jgi:hypothetical protein
MSNTNPPEPRTSLRPGDARPGGRLLGELNQRNVAERRHKKGECPTCGNKTHKIGLFGKRTALTVEGLCLYGRCLLCNPVEGYARRPQAADAATPSRQQSLVHPPEPASPSPIIPSGLPSNFVIETENRYRDIPDDGTMVSNITMDHRLIVGARNWNGEVEAEGDDDESLDAASWGGGQGRPEPSVGGLDEMQPPQRRALSKIRSDDPTGPSSYSRAFSQPARYSSQHEAMMDQVGFDIAAPLETRPRKNHRPTPVTSSRHFDESLSAASLLGRPRHPSPSSNSRVGNSSRVGGTDDLRISSNSDDLDFRLHHSHGEEKLEIDAGSRAWDTPSADFATNDTHSSASERHGVARSRFGVDDDVLMQAETYGDAAFDRDLRSSRGPTDRIGSDLRRNQSQSDAVAPIPTRELERSRTSSCRMMNTPTDWDEVEDLKPM